MKWKIKQMRPIFQNPHSKNDALNNEIIRMDSLVKTSEPFSFKDNNSYSKRMVLPGSMRLMKNEGPISISIVTTRAPMFRKNK